MGYAPKLIDPKPWEGTYSLSLWCDAINDEHDSHEFPHYFNGHSYHDCKTQAMGFGWVLHKGKRTATCPKCCKRWGVRQQLAAITRMNRPNI